MDERGADEESEVIEVSAQLGGQGDAESAVSREEIGQLMAAVMGMQCEMAALRREVTAWREESSAQPPREPPPTQ